MSRITDPLRPRAPKITREERAARKEKRREESQEKYIQRACRVAVQKAGEGPLLALVIALAGWTPDTVQRDTGMEKTLIQAVFAGHIPVTQDFKTAIIQIIQDSE